MDDSLLFGYPSIKMALYMDKRKNPQAFLSPSGSAAARSQKKRRSIGASLFL